MSYVTRCILLTMKLLHKGHGGDIKSVLYSEINKYGVELSFLYRGVLYLEGPYSKVSMLYTLQAEAT